MITSVNPLFKWTGSKRKMFPKYAPIFAGLEFDTFVDMCGGTGITSVWINKNFPDKKIILNEYNIDIFNIYSQLKTNYTYFINAVNQYEAEYMALDGKENRKAYYLCKREFFHENYHGLAVEDRTPLLYFLMCTNFNGIWQAKKSSGLYYTPFGNGGEVKGIYNRTAMVDFVEMVEKAELRYGSYEDIHFDDNSLLFADPPYISSHTRYDDRGSFSDLMQAQMAEYLVKHSEKNKIAFCNKDHPLFREIFKGFTFEEFNVKYTASSKDGEGSLAREILVHNFGGV